MFKMLLLHACFIIIWSRLQYFVDDRYSIYTCMLKGEGNKILIALKLGEFWKKGGLGNTACLYQQIDVLTA